MQVILTNLKPIKYNILDGTITIQELKIWPNWTHPKFKIILIYKFADKKHTLDLVLGKLYTFDKLSKIANDALNIDGENGVSLSHNKGRVTWQIFPPKQPLNPKLSTGMIQYLKPTQIKLSSEILELFKLKNAKADNQGIMTGETIEKSSMSFCFSDASVIFLTCDECDKTTQVNNTKTKTITAMSVSAGLDDSITADLTHTTTISFKNNYTNQLNFHIQDKNENDLSIKRVL